MSKKFLFILMGVLLTAASTADAAYVVGDKMPVSSAADGKKIVIEAASTTVKKEGSCFIMSEISARKI